MERKKCHVKECGTTVLILEVAGQPLAVNPVQLELVVADEAGRGRLMSGYQPHYHTCVDIAARRQRGQPDAP